MNDIYKSQFKLLLQIIPFIAEEPEFALKGGTAINLFVQDLPRLSVDIDLSYLPFDNRQKALHKITTLLEQIKKQIKRKFSEVTVQPAPHRDGYNAKLICISPKGFRVKIEVNTVMRGYIFETRLLPCVNRVVKEFETYTEARILSHADLYGSKMCAALDRQHPRDLFDIYYFLKNGGITKDVKVGFIASLLSHKRPIHEILSPTFIDQKQVYKNQFKGMTLVPFSYKDFEITRCRFIDELHESLEDNDKEFLLSFKSGNPKWSLISEPVLKELPAVQWKLKNLKKLIEANPKKHQRQYEALKKKLFKLR